MENEKKIYINTFGLPAIPFGSDFLPVVSLIRHDLHLKIGVPISETEKTGDILIKKKFVAESSEEGVFVSMEEPYRVASIDNVYLTYRRYLPDFEIVYTQVKLLEDVESLKLVPYQVFRTVYEMHNGEPLSEEVSPVSPEVVKFVLARRWLTPQVLVGWNADPKLKRLLPYSLWINK